MSPVWSRPFKAICPADMSNAHKLTGLVSITVPVFNESGAIEALYESTRKVLGQLGRPWELIFVNDGSTDGSDEKLDAIAARDPHVRVVHFRRNFGQTAAMMAGFDHARGEVHADLLAAHAEKAGILDPVAEPHLVAVPAARRPCPGGRFLDGPARA